MRPRRSVSDEEAHAARRKRSLARKPTAVSQAIHAISFIFKWD
ncbi:MULTISPECIES: hypothetical protein [Priestia]|nr:hypothetical protein [Priestia megaterium]